MPTPAKDLAFSPVDQEALQRAVELLHAAGGVESTQMQYILRDDGWQEAAEFAVYHFQQKNLRLRPWQPPPSWINPKDVEVILAKGDDGALGHYRAASLVKRLLEAKLSQFEPNPQRALAEAKAKRVAEKAEPEAEAPVPGRTSLSAVVRSSEVAHEGA